MKEIEKIKALAQNIPSFPLAISSSNSGGFKEYKMDKGVCLSWEVENLPYYQANVHKWYCSPGTEFPSHSHAETETIVVYEGSMIIHFYDGVSDIEVKAGESIYFKANLLHSASFPEGSRFYTIMVPAARYYPGGE